MLNMLLLNNKQSILIFMTPYHYPESIEKLINLFKKFPGVGRKTAERYAFDLLEWKKEELSSFSQNLKDFAENVKRCSTCHCLLERTCHFCTDTQRDSSILCVLSSAKDVYLFEETKIFKGRYHVLNHLINPIEGKGPADIGLDKLIKRFDDPNITEAVIALDNTLEADATALYIKKALQNKGVTLSRLASGLPMGSSLEYIDEGTLTKALIGRGVF